MNKGKSNIKLLKYVSSLHMACGLDWALCSFVRYVATWLWFVVSTPYYSCQRFNFIYFGEPVFSS